MDDPIFDDDDIPTWIFTFADLMSLLLVFFILLFSLSRMTQSTLESTLASIQVAISSKNDVKGMDKKPMQGGNKIIAPVPLKNTQTEKSKDTSQEEQDAPDANLPIMQRDLISQLEAYKLNKQVTVTEDGDKLTIRVDGQSLFDSGQAEVSYDAEFILKTLLYTFKKYPNYTINIQGHTDNIPIKTTRFPSNWELSAIRATTILRYYLDNGISPTRMTATGYADSLPLVPNDNAKDRAENRRAEFVLERMQKPRKKANDSTQTPQPAAFP